MASRGGWRERERERQFEKELRGHLLDTNAKMALISLTPNPEKKIKEPDFS
jgi:hypothetical protein